MSEDLELIADWLVQHAYHDRNKLLRKRELLLQHKQGHVQVEMTFTFTFML